MGSEQYHKKRGMRQSGKMNAPLSKKLNEVKWGEFKIGDLFEIQKISNMLSKEDLSDDYSYPAYSSDSENNGIIGYTNNPEFICDEKHPVYITFGDHTRTLNIARKSFSVLDNVKVLLPCTNKNNSLLFMISVWKKQIPNLGYARHWKVAKNCILSLPITPENKIDFDFMEAFIRELEEERIRELAAYLKVSGFDNYKLSKCESFALAHFNELKWKEFSYSEIFNHIKQGRRLKKGDQKPGKIPFVMAGTTNTGIVGYISNPIATFPKNSITIDIFGNTFYRNYDFGAGDDTGVYWNDDKNYSSEQMLYFSSCMEKSIRGKFSFGKKLRSSQSFDFRIFLPTTPDGSPDYAFMETFISAVQKFVIKDVVLYADKKIAATKQAVHKNPSDYKTPEGFGALKVAEHN